MDKTKKKKQMVAHLKERSEAASKPVNKKENEFDSS